MKISHSYPTTVAGLTAALFLFFSLGAALGQALFPADIPPTGASPAATLGLLALACLLEALPLAALVRSAHRRSRSLQLALFAVIFGVQTFLPQIEALVFNFALRLPYNVIWSSMVRGLILAAGIAWLGARWAPENEPQNSQPGLLLTPLRLLLLAAVVYPFLYFLFGYFVAWQFEAVRAFYTGINEQAGLSTEAGSFPTRLYLLQVARGFGWILAGLPVLYAARGSRIRKSLLLGSLFSILMSAQLLLPNPYMPVDVAMPHLLETALSDFIWGFCIGALLIRNPAPVPHASTAIPGIPGR